MSNKKNNSGLGDILRIIKSGLDSLVSDKRPVRTRQTEDGRIIRDKVELQFDKEMRKRLLFVVLFVFVGFIAATIKLGYINIVNGEEYSRQVLQKNQRDSSTIPAKRGDILDSKGNKLATDVKVYKLVLDPHNIVARDDTNTSLNEKTKEITTAALKDILGISSDDLNEFLKDPTSRNVDTKIEISSDLKEEFEAYQNENSYYVVGVSFSDSYRRVYPYNELACHVLGFEYIDGNDVSGGLEEYYDEELSGEDGKRHYYRSEGNVLQGDFEEPRNGQSLVTSIDIEAQSIVQNAVARFKSEYFDAKKDINVLVMNPNNGEIIAMYNDHQYDPNDYSNLEPTTYLDYDEDFQEYLETMTNYYLEQGETYSDTVDRLARVYDNPIISDVFEPGSTYKPFTVAGSLEEGITTTENTYYCDGGQQVADYYIRCHGNHGMVTTTQALEYSCNDTMMELAAQEGSKIFDKYQRLFGFGQKTNIDISGEPSEANMHNAIYYENTLNPVELATSSFGQGASCTMMQLGAAFCSLINGGNYYKPHVVKQILDSEGNVVKNVDDVLVAKTVSEETSDELREMLHGVVLNGTGKKGAIEGYSIGGKTGTAETGDRTTGNYILSFIGFAPVEDPQVVIYCRVKWPDTDDQSESAAGVLLFHEVAEDLLPYLGIPKTETDEVDTSIEIGSW